MKKILLILLTLFLFIGCNKDEKHNFAIKVDPNSINFKPIPGGAIMSYDIPANEDIYAITATYTNAVGKEMTVGGTYGSTELVIKGFINKESSAMVKVSYISSDNRKSEPIDLTFSTLESSAVSVFNNINVEPYWTGFMVKFNAPEGADGFVNIGYMGTDPNTGEYKVLLKETKLIDVGENRFLYSNISSQGKEIEVVVWTEDFYQNEAKRMNYKIIPKMVTKIDPSTLTYIGSSWEDEKNKFGVKYLFDGDTKNYMKMTENKGDYLFATFSHISTEPTGIIDLKTPQSIAYFRMYAPLNDNLKYSGALDKLPAAITNHFKLYVSNDVNASEDEWVEVGEYHQSNNLNEALWWCYPMFNPAIKYKSIEELKAAEPCFCQVDFDIMTEKYRYLKIKYLSLYRASGHGRVMSNEMEVYTEK